MNKEVNLSLLVSNIANGKQDSHCRLCLKTIEDFYVRFEDGVALDTTSESRELQPLSELINMLLGPEATEEVPFLEAACTDCVEKALAAFKFIQNCQKTNNMLHNLFDDLLSTLNVRVEANISQSLCVLVDENNSQLFLMDKTTPPSIVNAPESKLICLECDEEFATPTKYKNHFKEHHNVFFCDSCNESFLNEQGLIRHSCSTRYKCPDCKQYRKTESDLTVHHEKVHQIHVCKECGKSFQGSEKLKIHEEKHLNKSRCPKCGKSYTTKDFYLKHVKLCEQGLLDPHPFRTNLERPYVCKECGKRYSTSGGLRVHNRFEHGDGKPHVCPRCDKKFTAPSYLKVHMVTHTKEKNFVCNICGNRFVSKEALLYHTRRHTGEKPYKCDHCPEAFVNASARAEHIKYKHVGPTLMCEICSRKFVTPHFLRTHIKRHHEKESEWYTVTEQNARIEEISAKRPKNT